MASKSKYNRYFDFGTEIIKCKNFDYIIKTSKAKAGSGNPTTQLRNHLKNAHPPMFDALKKIEEDFKKKKEFGAQSLSDQQRSLKHSFISNFTEEEGCSTAKKTDQPHIYKSLRNILLILPYLLT